jgi:PEP-CTERM motif
MKTKSRLYLEVYLALMGFAPLCQGVDVILTPNIISGQVRFTNTNSIAVGILNGQQLRNCLIRASSSTPPGFNASTEPTNCPGGPISPIAGLSYNLSVESAGGVTPPGVTYNVTGRADLYLGSESGFYQFADQNAFAVTPTAGAKVDFQECAGIIDFKIGTNACATPASVNALFLQTLSVGPFAQKNVFHPVSQTYFIVPAMGQTYPIQYTIQQGTDPFSDRILVKGQTTVTPQCDVVTPVCIESPLGSGSGGGGGTLGQIVGNWDIVGEFEVKFFDNFTRLYAFDGPDGNFRLDTIPGTNFTTPSSSPPNVPWQLENLPSGNYKVGGMSLLQRRGGRTVNWFTPESLGTNGIALVTVMNKTTTNSGITDLGNTFVMTPGLFFGDILLRDPFTATNGVDNGAYSGLRSLVFNADQDADGDGIFNPANIDVTVLNDGGDNPGPGLKFDVFSNELSVTGDSVFAFVDLRLDFHVTVLDPLRRVKDNSLQLLSPFRTESGDNGSYIQEFVGTTPGGTDLVNFKQVEWSWNDPNQIDKLTDTAAFAPQDNVWVTKNILVWASGVNETAKLGSFTQRFSQTVPEPGTLVLLGIAGLAGYLNRRLTF